MTTVGVIGAGQLGLMLGAAGSKLGLDFVFLDPKRDPPAAAVGDVIESAFDDDEALRTLAARADVVTYEFENVPVESARLLAERLPVHPPVAALREAQDRLSEKRLFEALGIPVAPWRPVDARADVAAAARALGFPFRLKTRRLGYDGKGQVLVREGDDPRAAWERLGGRPAVAERQVAFRRELSIIGARRRNGETALFPLIENRHREGILRVSTAPVEAPELECFAADYLRRLMEHLDYVGVLALELFDSDAGLMANEFAPRVHNSGHWTIEGAVTSQFESHLRAVLDLPLTDTSPRGHAAMINLIGEIPADPGVESAGFRLHDYGKIARPGRKLGHLTTVAESAAERDRRLSDALKIIENQADRRVPSPRPGQR